jgi:transcription initiation factor TFIID subunit TAF12
MNNHRVRFKLSLSSEQFLQVYQGIAKNVTARTDNGQVIQFQAQHIKPFLTHDGIYGYFEMMFSAEHKFMGIKRLN